MSADFQGKLKSFKVAGQAVASELERAYRGTGGNMTEIEEWKKQLDSANTPAAMTAVLKQATTLLGSKIDALGDQYSKGMGTTAGGLDLLNPKARDVYTRLTGQKPLGIKSGTSGMSFASEQEAAQAEAAGKIKKGDRITINGQSGVWQ